jgi:hypothetical protein
MRFEVSSGKHLVRPHLQENSQSQMAAGVAQVVEYLLLCKLEALSVNPSTTKKRKEREHKYEGMQRLFSRVMISK